VGASLTTPSGVPTHQYLQIGAAPETLLQRTLYGESHPTPEPNNLRGKPIRHYDEAGSAQERKPRLQRQPPCHPAQPRSSLHGGHRLGPARHRHHPQHHRRCGGCAPRDRDLHPDPHLRRPQPHRLSHRARPHRAQAPLQPARPPRQGRGPHPQQRHLDPVRRRPPIRRQGSTAEHRLRQRHPNRLPNTTSSRIGCCTSPPPGPPPATPSRT
jgi:hypothetical protein